MRVHLAIRRHDTWREGEALNSVKACMPGQIVLNFLLEDFVGPRERHRLQAILHSNNRVREGVVKDKLPACVLTVNSGFPQLYRL